MITLVCLQFSPRFLTPHSSSNQHTHATSTIAADNVYKSPQQVQVIRFTGAVSPSPIVCPTTAWAPATACFERLPASV